MKPGDKEFFNAIASRWDSMEINSLPEKVNVILDAVGVSEGASVLDLGTGTGVLIPYLLKRVGPGGRVKGVDGSEGMLAQARAKYGDAADYELFEQADFEESEIDGRYDLILLYCVYPHLQHPELTLEKLRHNNLTSAGRIVIAFPTNENFVNAVHREKKIESELLPSAPVLAKRLSAAGFKARSLDCGSDAYIVELS